MPVVGAQAEVGPQSPSRLSEADHWMPQIDWDCLGSNGTQQLMLRPAYLTQSRGAELGATSRRDSPFWVRLA